MHCNSMTSKVAINGKLGCVGTREPFQLENYSLVLQKLQ